MLSGSQLNGSALTNNRLMTELLDSEPAKHTHTHITTGIINTHFKESDLPACYLDTGSLC